MKETNNVTKSIAHTKWNCKYHIVFAPKYRRKVFFEEKRLEISERQKRNDDIPKMGKHEICIPKQRVLVYRILCRYSGQKYPGDKGIHRKSVESG